MKLFSNISAFTQLREGRTWSLLASNDGPKALALFQEVFTSSDPLPQSIVIDRLNEAINDLRTQGYDMPTDALGLLKYWRGKGWVYRTLQEHSNEEDYGLTPESITALRFATNLMKPRALATESRLLGVTQLVARLDEETDSNSMNRLAFLYTEQDRIKRSIDETLGGCISVISDERAVELAREILGLATELIDDFQNVRVTFERMNQELRRKQIDAGSERGKVLTAFFNGLDYLKATEAGRTFDAFNSLLRDVDMSTSLDNSLNAIAGRDFYKLLSNQERRNLLHLTELLSREADVIQDVQRKIATSLNKFVRTDDLAKNRIINELLNQASLLALDLKDTMDIQAGVGFSISQSSVDLHSISQYALKEPDTYTPPPPMKKAEPKKDAAEELGRLVKKSEINYKELKRNIQEALSKSEFVKLSTLMTDYPVTQGLGTLVGYLRIFKAYGRKLESDCEASWLAKSGEERRVQLPDFTIHQSRLKVLMK